MNANNEIVRRDIKISLENAASIGKTGQDYTEYVKKLTDGLMENISRIHNEYEERIRNLENQLESSIQGDY